MEEDSTSKKISLKFSEHEEEPEFSLLELDKELQNLLEQNSDEQIVLKAGLDSKSSVLCTSNNTYSVRQLIQSNSLMLFRSSHSSEWTLQDTKYSYLEIEHIYGSITIEDKISYWDEDALEEIPSSISFQDFICQVPASENEIKAFLGSNFIIIKDNTLYRLSPSYIMTLIDWVFAIMHQLRADFSAISIQEFKKTAIADQFDTDAVVAILWSISRTPFLSQVDTVVIDKSLVCFWIGRFILEDVITTEVSHFLSKWTEKLPESCKDFVSLDLLKGFYFYAAPDTIQYFSSLQLPRDPTRCFQVLFQAKSKWLYDEIWPFVENLAVDKSKVEALLLKYGRKQVTKNGVYINSRSTW
ncbi:DNA replication factor C complex subunit Dcc1 [Schizosaccharomyces cryophilus OY26]|uniref:DNA replication factor C complex subunit Dcc1 n=1 Tax=Schizosaccharomyces cryophilus (strain OY26 / ATCC MYA-4695 / CBS 11777 / NBRC 106824 / NRRL Y48691) TaxID=653667 RepID=S9WY74_SCHCR|nr:DNA replication factor C complex subunit Dcc1 [Schizosaccharomyces cryophilus OY26]EPY49682.1 DNA replication factor C complex subunit Dcc1 [Schizosaccharomyces cryophilus OY26]